MNDVLEFIVKPYRTYTSFQIGVEFFSAFFGIVSVIYAAKRNILAYPTGIISTLVYTVLLFQWQLYGDMMVNFYYTIMSIYGWILWQKYKTDDVHVPIQNLHKKDIFATTIISILSALGVLAIYIGKPMFENGLKLVTWQHLNGHLTLINYMDSITTAIFLVGMWLMAKRKIENWLFWIVGDLIAIPMFIIKGYAITSFMYLIFVLIAVFGYFAWKKEFSTQKKYL